MAAELRLDVEVDLRKLFVQLFSYLRFGTISVESLDRS